jgi:hypothetical protein
VLEKVTGLKELETSWNIDDVARANALLDMRSELESELMRRLEARA